MAQPRARALLTPLFRACWRFKRPMTLGVRGIALDGAERVMLVRHTYTPGWHLPGGGVERGETADRAMRKEFAEEAGLSIEGPMSLLGVYLNPVFQGDHVLLFRAHGWRPCDSDSEGEIAERGFFALDALPSDTVGAARRRLNEVFLGAAISQHW